MPPLLRFSRALDRFALVTGNLVRWLTLGMVLIGAFNAVVRYLDRFTGLGLSSNTYLELQWYFFSLVFLLGAAYTLQQDAHVRVDVLYGRLSARGKAVINVAGTVLFLIPFCLLMLWSSIPFVESSFRVLEVSPDPGGLPRYPLKAMIPVAFVLLLLQAFSLLARNVAVLLGASGEDLAASLVHDGEPTVPEAHPPSP
jgi:TRAP-type mannitol/chloroaromatic compound transport system permease small subunit